MTGCKLMIGALVVAVAAVCVPFRSSLAVDTNAVPDRINCFEFQNAPMPAVLNWLTRLLDRPLITPLTVANNHAGVAITFKSEGRLTRDEAIQALATVLEMNGWYLIQVGNRYYRLVTASETNKVKDVSRTEIELVSDRVFVDGKSTSWGRLDETLAPLVTRDSEVWIHESSTTPQSGTSNRFSRVVAALQRLQVREIYAAYMPPEVT